MTVTLKLRGTRGAGRRAERIHRANCTCPGWLPMQLLRAGTTAGQQLATSEAAVAHLYCAPSLLMLFAVGSPLLPGFLG